MAFPKNNKKKGAWKTSWITLSYRDKFIICSFWETHFALELHTELSVMLTEYPEEKRRLDTIKHLKVVNTSWWEKYRNKRDWSCHGSLLCSGAKMSRGGEDNVSMAFFLGQWMSTRIITSRVVGSSLAGCCDFFLLFPSSVLNSC